LASFPRWPTYPAPPPTPRKVLRPVGFVLVVAIAVVGVGVIAGLFKNGVGGLAATPVPTPVPPYSDLVAAARFVAYDKLLRDPEAHDGELVRFTNATVYSVSGELILLTTRCGGSCWVDPVFVAGYQGDRLLSGDVVELIGTSRGVTTPPHSFEMPGETMPRIDAASIRVIGCEPVYAVSCN